MNNTTDDREKHQKVTANMFEEIKRRRTLRIGVCRYLLGDAFINEHEDFEKHRQLDVRAANDIKAVREIIRDVNIYIIY